MTKNSDGRKRDINFFAQLKRAQSAKTHVVSRLRLTVAGIALAAAFCAGGYGLFLNNSIRQQTEAVAAMRTYLEDEGNQLAYQTMSRLQGDVRTLRRYNEACRKYIDQLREVSRVDSGNFSDVWKLLPDGVRITAYHYSEPVLSVECTTADKDAPARFARNLNNSNLFKEVAYEGFSSARNLSDEDYTFQIECTLW